jgi:hypothetical protein
MPQRGKAPEIPRLHEKHVAHPEEKRLNSQSIIFQEKQWNYFF